MKAEKKGRSKGAAKQSRYKNSLASKGLINVQLVISAEDHEMFKAQAAISRSVALKSRGSEPGAPTASVSA